MASMTSPQITVLMPVYNGEKYLNEAIDSILGQTFGDFEFLVIDDGSTDGTPGILDRYSDLRLRVINNKSNLGIAANLNIGISMARGKYIARMDADDISLPHRFAEQVKFMETNPHIAVCGTWVELIGKKKVPWVENNILKDPADPEEIRCRFLFNCVLKHPSVIMRKDVLLQGGYRYDEKVNRAEDYDFWVRISKKHDISNLEMVLLKYRLHEESISQIHKHVNHCQADEIRKRQLKALGIRVKKKELQLHHELSKVIYNEFQRLRTPKKELEFPRQMSGSPKHAFPYHLLTQASDWLQKIVEANQKVGIYHEATLLHVMAKKWRDISACISVPPWITGKNEKKKKMWGL